MTLVHEREHVANGDGFEKDQVLGENDFSHSNIFFKQMNDPTFSETTMDFREGLLGNVAKFLESAANTTNSPYQPADIVDQASKFDSFAPKTGYTLNVSGGAWEDVKVTLKQFKK